MRGETVSNVHPILRMFGLCDSMKWNHLPETGGLNMQDPEMLEGFEIIFRERAIHEREEQEKREREQKQQMGKSGRRGRR